MRVVMRTTWMPRACTRSGTPLRKPWRTKEARKVVARRCWRAPARGRGEGVVRAATFDRGAKGIFKRLLLMQERYLAPLEGLWGKLIPMTTLFFFMTFVNAILDSTKDTLVVTAFGGAEQLIFLTVYAALPCSVLFLMLYSKMANRLQSGPLFYATLLPFVGFFALFGAVLFPFQHVLHPSAESWINAIPTGLEGAVAMIQHWTYTLFYVFSELWGDVVLSLLFWGLANETTNVEEARIIYPLFGIGANFAQASAGRLLRWLADHVKAGVGTSEADAWALQLKILMIVVVGCSCCIGVLHQYIRKRTAGTGEAGVVLKPKKKKLGLKESVQAIASSKEILCLATIAIAQGLAQILFEVTWKGQIRMLHPSPARYSAFMGDVATASGIFTFISMFAAPLLFRTLGWSGTAQITPQIMIMGGWVFFLSSMWALHSGLMHAQGILGPMVICGAILFVFGKAAKYSLSKPAEEMVYIGLDEEKRTKGKAAVDVVGSQFGKSSGSLFQQGLLLGLGTLSKALPVLMLSHSAVIVFWIMAIDVLAHHQGHMLSFDEEEVDTNDLACDLKEHGGNTGTASA